MSHRISTDVCAPRCARTASQLEIGDTRPSLPPRAVSRAHGPAAAGSPLSKAAGLISCRSIDLILGERPNALEVEAGRPYTPRGTISRTRIRSSMRVGRPDIGAGPGPSETGSAPFLSSPTHPCLQTTVTTLYPEKERWWLHANYRTAGGIEVCRARSPRLSATHAPLVHFLLTFGPGIATGRRI